MCGIPDKNQKIMLVQFLILLYYFFDVKLSFNKGENVSLNSPRELVVREGEKALIEHRSLC